MYNIIHGSYLPSVVANSHHHQPPKWFLARAAILIFCLMRSLCCETFYPRPFRTDQSQLLLSSVVPTYFSTYFYQTILMQNSQKGGPRPFRRSLASLEVWNLLWAFKMSYKRGLWPLWSNCKQVGGLKGLKTVEDSAKSRSRLSFLTTSPSISEYFWWFGIKENILLLR